MTCMPWTPIWSNRAPDGISSVTSTSAIRLLRVASSPTKSMPTARRITLRPPSAPTRYCARSGFPVGHEYVDTVVVLRQAGHLDPTMDRDSQLVDPAEHDPLDVVLEEGERVRVPGGEVAEVEHRAAETDGLRDLPLGEEPPRDPALVEDLERARVEPARPRADQLCRRTPLEDRHLDPRQLQLSREHHAGRPASDDEYVVHPNPVLWARLSSVEDDRGLAASPLLRCMLRVAGSGGLLAFVVSGALALAALASAGLTKAQMYGESIPMTTHGTAMWKRWHGCSNPLGDRRRS